MNRQEATKEAYRRAASCLETAMSSGWPATDDGEERYETPADGRRVCDALNRLVAELDRRGGITAPSLSSEANRD